MAEHRCGKEEMGSEKKTCEERERMMRLDKRREKRRKEE